MTPITLALALLAPLAQQQEPLPVHNTGIAAVHAKIEADYVSIEASIERGDGAIHVFDRATAEVRPTGLSSLTNGIVEGDYVHSGPHLGILEYGDWIPNEDRRLMMFDLRDSSVRYGPMLDSAAVYLGFLQMEEDLLLMLVPESDEGDMNGDGDLFDRVLVTVDMRTRRRSNLGLDATEFVQLGPWVVATVSESSHGNTDLTGDRDTEDEVQFVIDPLRRLRFNAGLANWDLADARAWGDRLVLAAREEQQGRDLNGDGDSDDWQVLFLVDPVTGSRELLGHGTVLATRDDLMIYQLDEVWESRDINGDGDTLDRVLMVHDGTAPRSTGLAGSLVLQTERKLWCLADELGNQIDFDGDGRQEGKFLVAFQVEDGALAPTRLQADWAMTSGDLIALVDQEYHYPPSDGNGDQDTLDESVTHVFDTVNHTVHEIGIAIDNAPFQDPGLHAVPSGFFVIAKEADSAGEDFNGDGDQGDLVLFHWSRAGGLVNHGLVVTDVTIHGNRAALHVHEGAGGFVDLNGDGDTDDEVVFVWDDTAAEVHPTGLAVKAPTVFFTSVESTWLTEDMLAVTVGEIAQNQDLDGDGELETRATVLQLVDLSALGSGN